MENLVEVVKQLDNGDFFVAILDGETGQVIAKAWTPQPENWMAWGRRIGAEYYRLMRRGVGISPARAAYAARMAVMAAGPSETPFIERWELVKFPPLP